MANFDLGERYAYPLALHTNSWIRVKQSRTIIIIIVWYLTPLANMNVSFDVRKCLWCVKFEEKFQYVMLWWKKKVKRTEIVKAVVKVAIDFRLECGQSKCYFHGEGEIYVCCSLSKQSF
ncbi:hypothetical protein V8G54_022028 [Vigna mungo]|uniref:Uncharacterized protein n=1 Tax=Vigna mungo TaxID=3915 RepID=A0AAQ3NFG9_VIGMU